MTTESNLELEKGLQKLDTGDYEEACQSFDSYVKSRKPGNKDYANGLFWLGQAQLKLDDQEGARETLERAEKEYRKLKNCDEELAGALTRAAEAHSNLDEHLTADQKLEEALELGREACGPFSTQLADTISIHGMSHLKQNLFDSAEKKLSKAFGLRRGLHGTKHSEIAQSMNQLSAFYAQSGKFAPAEVMARQALEMQESIIGSEHPEYGATLLNLATVFVKQGRMTKAEPYATEALEVLEARLPDSHSSHIAALDRLGSVMLSTNKNEEARDTYNKALLLSQARWGKDSAHTAASLIGLGLANLNCGDYRSSEKYLSIALDLLQHSPELDSTIEYSLLQQLACSYVFQLKLGDAVRLVPDSLRARHTANFNETIDTLNKVIDFVGSQVENVRK